MGNIGNARRNKGKMMWNTGKRKMGENVWGIAAYGDFLDTLSSFLKNIYIDLYHNHKNEKISVLMTMVTRNGEIVWKHR